MKNPCIRVVSQSVGSIESVSVGVCEPLIGFFLPKCNQCVNRKRVTTVVRCSMPILSRQGPYGCGLKIEVGARKHEVRIDGYGRYQLENISGWQHAG